MPKSILSIGIVAAIAAVANATTVSVLEFGKGGVVHSTEPASPNTSAQGVMSFWRSLHEAGNDGKPRKSLTTQRPGMSLVPDLFNRAEGGIVVGLMGDSIDLESMPTVAGIMKENASVGQFNVHGKHGRQLLKSVTGNSVLAPEFESAMESLTSAVVSEKGNKLEAVSVNVDCKKNAADVDAALSRMLKSIAKQADAAGSTIVVHLVFDNESKDSRRRLSDEVERNLDQNGDDANANTYQIPGIYVDGVFVTRYKSIHQIQYFNVVLWTAVGLLTILFAANMMTMNMPLMPDTLLFGESAKMVAE